MAANPPPGAATSSLIARGQAPAALPRDSSSGDSSHNQETHKDPSDEATPLLSSTMGSSPPVSGRPHGTGMTTKPPVQEAELAALDEAIRLEHSMTFMQAIRLHPGAVGWSAFVSIGVIMLAFDPQLLGNFFAMSQFQKDFGYAFEDGFIISPAWQSGLSLGNPIGQVLGALAAGIPLEYYGRRLTFGVCVALTGALVFIQFFARSLEVLLVGELLGGLVLGCYVVIAPAYASEVCPLAIRAQVTSYVNLCFVMGQLLGNVVTKLTSQLDTHWAYSIPFALQWFWVALILPGMFWVPESPWWLVRQGRLPEAEKTLRRLASKGVDVTATLAVIVETDRLEREMEAGSTYMDCFRGVNLRRTEISIGVYCTQVLSGIYLINYGTYFFEQAGLPEEDAFTMNVGFLAVGFLGTVISWFLMLRFGRRTMYNTGLFGLVVLQLVIGILDCIPGRPDGVAWGESALMLVWNFCYDLSVGPVCFVLISECSATRVRSKSIAVCTAAQAVLGIGMTVAIPYMITPDGANMQGKLGFFFGGLAALCFVWAHFRVPETMGRTYEELDLLFEKRVPARMFKKYRLDDEGEHHH